MKKIIAWLSAMALASTMFVSGVSAANANVATITESVPNDEVTINLDWNTDAFSWSILDTDKFVVNAKNLKTWNSVDLSNATSSWSDAFTVTNRWKAVELTSWTWTESIVLNKSAAFTWNTADYLITVVVKHSDNPDNNWKIFQWYLYKANQNQVKVTASVAPILSIDLDHTWIDFWQLDVNVLKTITWSIAISTNAAWWTSLFVQSANTWAMVDINNSNNKISAASWITVDMSTWTTADNYWYWIRVKSTASWTDIWWYTSNALVADSAFNWAYYWPMTAATATLAAQTTWWSNWANVEIEYWVRISPLQPAWQYSDTITYTVTWNF